MIFIRIICEKYGAFFDLSSFLSDRSDDSNDFNSENTFPEEEPLRNVVSESVNKVVGLQISKKLTLDATSKVLNLMNSMPEANIKLPEDPRAIKSYSHQQINYKFFLKCTQCDELVEDKTKCSCDLPARAGIQNFIGPNGKFACPYCQHPGDPIKNKSGRTTIRYVQHESTANMLWFYPRFSIVGLLPTRTVKHFEKLSAAIFILCKKNATFTEIHDACEMLRQFAKDFEMIYGPGAVTMN